MYRISSRRQLTGGVPPACGLGELLTTPHLKKLPCYETFALGSVSEWRAVVNAVVNLNLLKPSDFCT